MAHIVVNGNMREVQWGSFPYANDALSLIKQNLAALENESLKGNEARVKLTRHERFEKYGAQVAMPPLTGNIEDYRRTSESGVDPVGKRPVIHTTNYEADRGRAVTVNADSSVSFHSMTPEELIKHGKGHR